MSVTHPSTRKTGQVKFFNSTKGYGFILPKEQEGSDDVEDVFVHHTAIQSDGGFRSLCQDEEVEYDLIRGPKGMQAALVTGVGGGPVKGDLADAGQSYRRQSQDHSHQGQRHTRQYGYEQKQQQQYYPEYYDGASYRLQGYNPIPPIYAYPPQHHYHHQYSQQQGYAMTTAATTSPISAHYSSPSSIIHYSVFPSYISSHNSSTPPYSYPTAPSSSSPIDSIDE